MTVVQVNMYYFLNQKLLTFAYMPFAIWNQGLISHNHLSILGLKQVKGFLSNCSMKVA